MATDRPAFKTSAFWATVVLTNIGLLMSSGLVMEGWPGMAVGWVVTLLTALGYKGWQKPAELPPAE